MMSTLNQQNVLVCRFCFLQVEEHDIFRIAWHEWQDSPLAAMYESVVKQPLPKECLEVYYCNNCAELLCQTAHALHMFQESDAYWRTIFVEAPSNAQTDIVAKNGEDSETKEMDSFEIRSVKIELIHGDFMNTEDEQIDIEPIESTNIDSPNDTNTTNEIETVVKKKRKRLNVSKIVKKDPKTARNDNLPCVLCKDVVFANRTLLNRHTEATHNMIQCIRCPFTSATRQSVKRHELVEHKRSIDTISPCPKCNKIFTDMPRLRLHIRNVHAPIVSSQCHVCSRIFKSSFHLKKHMKNVHVDAIHQCDICKRKFRQKKNLKIHIMIVHVKEKKFICTSCGRKFTNQTSWKIHEARPSCQIQRQFRREIGTYSPNPIFPCSMCDVKFSDLNYGRIHYRTVHKVEDVSNVCMICNHLSSSPDELSEHLNTKHRDLSCMLCKRFYRSQITLKSHMATHSTKERPFVCEICNATFIRTSHLQEHQRRVHFAEKNYKCTDCDLRFVTNCEMLCHWRHRHDTNKKFQCNWCDKKYASHSALSLHEGIHTGIGKYNCDLCGQNFRLNNQLIKHFQIDHRDHVIR